MRRHGRVRVGPRWIGQGAMALFGAGLALASPAIAAADDPAGPATGPGRHALSRQGPRLEHLMAPIPAETAAAILLRPRRGTGGMYDVRPFAAMPLRLSAGTRLTPRLSMRGNGRDGLLAAPRGMGPRFGRPGAPTLLIGLQEGGDRGLAFGADAGVAMGRLSAAPYRMGRSDPRREADGRHDSVNPLARATMSYRF